MGAKVSISMARPGQPCNRTKWKDPIILDPAYMASLYRKNANLDSMDQQHSISMYSQPYLRENNDVSTQNRVHAKCQQHTLYMAEVASYQLGRARAR